ncbi:hypothetical protein BsWGS_24348 [Bradybaena similaris]
MGRISQRCKSPHGEYFTGARTSKNFTGENFAENFTWENFCENFTGENFVRISQGRISQVQEHSWGEFHRCKNTPGWLLEWKVKHLWECPQYCGSVPGTVIMVPNQVFLQHGHCYCTISIIPVTIYPKVL